MKERAEATTRTYRKGWSLRIFGLVFLAMSLLFLVAFWGGAISGEREASLLEMFIPILFLLVGGLITASAFKDRIILTQSSIEMQTLSSRKTLPLDKIRGRRRYLDKGSGDSPDVWHLIIESDDDRFPTLDFEENYYTFDDSFRAWLNALPDLDLLDKDKKKTSNFGLV